MSDGTEHIGSAGTPGRNGRTESDFAAEAAQALGPFVQALSSGVRIELLLALRRRAWIVAELSELTELAPSNMSYHLGVLRTSGLVLESRVGRRHVYSLAPWVRAELQGGVLKLSLDNGLTTVEVSAAVRHADGSVREVKPGRAEGAGRPGEEGQAGA